MRALAILAVVAAAATPVLAQTTVDNPGTTTTTTATPSTTTTAPPASTTTVTSPDGTATTVQAPPGSTVTTTGNAPATVTQPAPLTGSGGDVVAEHEVYDGRRGIKRSGVEVDLLGGALGYRTSPRGGANAGPSYGFALGFRTGGPVGLELSYQGATYTPSGTRDLTGGVDRITENGAQALLKLGGQAGPFDLYVLGGAGISRFTVAGGSTDTSVAGGTAVHNGTIYKVPAGVGLDFHIPVGGPDLLIGARGQYNFIFNQSDVFTGVSNSDRDADQIQAQVNVGMLF